MAERSDPGELLPDWYMPAPSRRRVTGWRRAIVLLIVLSLLMIEAYGLCTTFGPVVLG
jgi:hypothetical protein